MLKLLLSSTVGGGMMKEWRISFPTAQAQAKVPRKTAIALASDVGSSLNRYLLRRWCHWLGLRVGSAGVPTPGAMQVSAGYFRAGLLYDIQLQYGGHDL